MVIQRRTVIIQVQHWIKHKHSLAPCSCQHFNPESCMRGTIYHQSFMYTEYTIMGHNHIQQSPCELACVITCHLLTDLASVPILHPWDPLQVAGNETDCMKKRTWSIVMTISIFLGTPMKVRTSLGSDRPQNLKISPVRSLSGHWTYVNWHSMRRYESKCDQTEGIVPIIVRDIKIHCQMLELVREWGREGSLLFLRKQFLSGLLILYHGCISK